MRPSQKQIAAITQHAMQPEQTTWPKTSAILWGLGTPNWELGTGDSRMGDGHPETARTENFMSHLCQTPNSRKMPKK